MSKKSTTHSFETNGKIENLSKDIAFTNKKWNDIIEKATEELHSMTNSWI